MKKALSSQTLTATISIGRDAELNETAAVQANEIVPAQTAIVRHEPEEAAPAFRLLQKRLRRERRFAFGRAR